MFTGIIEEIGKISNITLLGGGKKIRIKCEKILSDSKIDDSISINGICQTIINISGGEFEFISIEETIKKTTAKYWTVGEPVNLERALRLSDRLGGHLLLGHIDDTGKILKINKLQTSTVFDIQYPQKYSNYIIPQGSIAIDGVSLTISDIKDDKFSVSIIPHTLDHTILSFSKNGDHVNLEFDLIGKYVERIASNSGKESGLTIEKLRNLGY